MVVFFAVFAVDNFNCFPTGAPEAVCDTLQPNVNSHGAAQVSAAPYTINASVESVVAGETVIGWLFRCKITDKVSPKLISNK